MAMKREQVLFGVTILLVGLLSWQLYDEANNPLKRPTWPKKGELEVAKVRVPGLDKLAIPTKPGASESQRDLFAEPRDTRPLPKLKLGTELQLPEADPFAILAPPPIPGPGVHLWYRFLRGPALIEPFDFAAVDTPAAGGADADSESKPATSPSTTVDVKPTEAQLERRYDKVILKSMGGQTLWGRLLNPNKFDLKEDEAITFQIYDEKKDRAFAKHTYARDDVISYAVAKTIKNEIEIRKRKVKWIAGNEARIRDFVLWLIVNGTEEPEAFAEAERQIKKAIELMPNDPVNVVILGRILEETFRFEEAWKLYREMTEGAFKTSADAWISRARLESRLLLMADARASFERGVSLDTQGWRPKLVLAEFRMGTGEIDKALPLLEDARRNEPQGVEFVVVRARIRRFLGDAYLGLGMLDQAAEAYRKSLEASVDGNSWSQVGLAVVTALQKGKDSTDAAMKILDSVISIEPTMPALLERGLLKITKKDYLGARNDFQAAIGLDPIRDVRPISALAYLYLVTGHPEDALTAVERALANDPEDPYSTYLIGRIRRDRGLKDASRENLKKACMADLAFIDPVIDLGILASSEEFTELADRYYARALEIDPKNADVCALRGLNLLAASQIRRAREAFLAATQIDRNHPLARIGTAICAYYEDDPNGMKKELGSGVRDVRPSEDRFHQFAVELLKKVDIHEQKEEWIDGFDRGGSIRQPWTTQPVEGLRPQIQNGEVRVEGLFQRLGEVMVTQNLVLRNFRSIELDLTIPASGAKPDANQADVAVVVRNFQVRQGTPMVYFEASIVAERPKADGTTSTKFVYRTLEKSPQPAEVPFQWPVGKPVHVKIERDDDENRPLGRIYLDNNLVVSEIEFPRSGAAGEFQVGVIASGDSGRTCSFTFDNVRIVRKRI